MPQGDFWTRLFFLGEWQFTNILSVLCIMFIRLWHLCHWISWKRFIFTRLCWQTDDSSRRECIAISRLYLLLSMERCCVCVSIKWQVLSSIAFVTCADEVGEVVKSWLCLCVCLADCQQDYSENSDPIFMEFGVIIEPAHGKNRLTFDDDLLPDTDLRSLFQLL